MRDEIKFLRKMKLSDYEHVDHFFMDMHEQIELLEDYVKKLEVNLNACKNDYWFMSNLLEHYSSDKEQGVKDCIERMKFRAPLFNILKPNSQDEE